MIDIIDTVEKFDCLKSEWEQLEQGPRMRVFQTYAWCRAAWDCCLSKERGDKLWILRWHREGLEDVVIFPFYIDNKGTLRFIFDAHSDSLDTIYLPGGNRHICYYEAVGEMLHNSDIKQICLNKMSCESEALKYFSVLFNGATVFKDNAYSWLQIEKTENFLQSLVHMKSNDRVQLKTILRKTSTRSLRIISSEAGDSFPEERILQLKELSIKKSLRSESFFPDSFMQFTKKLYEIGVVDIAMIYDCNTCLGLNFVLKKGCYLLSWIFISADNRIPTELCVKYLANQSRIHKFTFDFGVGAYVYKLKTFRPFVSPTFAVLYGKSHYAQIKCLLIAGIRLIKDYAKRLLNKGAR